MDSYVRRSREQIPQSARIHRQRAGQDWRDRNMSADSSDDEDEAKTPLSPASK